MARNYYISNVCVRQNPRKVSNTGNKVMVVASDIGLG